ncbi:Efflux pump atB [Vanrija pseudolonga]|uniref:Efflux pump atB n=1 Tax=Vanrija pseudolonga TaxID=143232 RepID=A0AAF0YAH3_9TREE|nr:Efflux pump atB [Vanrija pseudolonga]
MTKSLSFGHQEPAPPTSVADADADERTLPGRLSQRTSQATLTPQSLPDGCSYGSIPSKDGEGAEKRVIWVDFPPASPENPICFSKSRKFLITAVVLLYTFWCSSTASAFSISAGTMCSHLHCRKFEAEAGIALYAWGAGIFPLIVAPLSEEFGRHPVYMFALIMLFVFHLANGVAKNMATVLMSRFFLGAAGSIGTSVVGGTISDIFIPAHRGVPMAISGFIVYFATGLGGAVFGYVDVRASWRWVWYVHTIGIGAMIPVVVFGLKETRTDIILRRRAAKLRKERGLADGGVYMHASEVDKVSFWSAVTTSLYRPFIFLTTEPIVMFFSLWVALANQWSVFYVQIAGLPYMMRNLWGFNTEQVGLMYFTTCIGAVFGLCGGQIQEHLYRKKAPTRGIEARLYAPMAGGILFSIGCFITGFTALPNIHWIGSAVGQVVVITSIFMIYVTAFTYVSECYGVFASSAIAGQSSARNLIGGCIAFATNTMFERMTPRWAIVMMASFAAVLALVPFVAFFYGPQIRARSKYSKVLMQQERDAIDAERIQREARGMDGHDFEDLEGDANGTTESHVKTKA